MTDQPDLSSDAQAARSLLSAAAVRERAHRILEHGLADRLRHFTVDLSRLEPCADEVVATIREAYPSLDIPFHARWRHFSAGGHDRWEAVMHGASWGSAAEMARAAFDLAIVSVLLDAGAGPQWRYEEGRTGETYARSEGLAVASFDMFVERRFLEQARRPVPGRRRRPADPDGGGSRGRLPGLAPTIRSSDWRAAPRCSTAWAGRSPRIRTSSARTTIRGPAASST